MRRLIQSSQFILPQSFGFSRLRLCWCLPSAFSPRRNQCSMEPTAEKYTFSTGGRHWIRKRMWTKSLTVDFNAGCVFSTQDEPPIWWKLRGKMHYAHHPTLFQFWWVEDLSKLEDYFVESHHCEKGCFYNQITLCRRELFNHYRLHRLLLHPIALKWLWFNMIELVKSSITPLFSNCEFQYQCTMVC